MDGHWPKPGEWWTHVGYGMMYWPSRKGPSFYIEDVIRKEPFGESWVIYSNNDHSGDYFVAQLYEFIQEEWEKAHGAGNVD